MALGILIGFLCAAVLMGGTAAVMIKKQRYEQRMQDMGKKFEVEKLILNDRIGDLQQQLKSVTVEKDIEIKYTNKHGFYTSRKTAPVEEEH